MPRSMAPPPSGEFSVKLTKSFGTCFFPAVYRKSPRAAMLTRTVAKPPTEKVEIIGEPNSSANVKTTKHLGEDNQTIEIKNGSVQAYVHPHRSTPAHAIALTPGCSEDVNTLLSLVGQLKGLPSNPNEDIYGFDTRIVLSTFEVQWDNGEEIEGAEAASNPTDENKETFKDVMNSILSLARQTAK